MEKTEFNKTVEEYASKYGNVEITEVKKGGYDYTGLVVRKPNVPMPVVNLDDLYNRYTDGSSLEECYKRVDKILNMKPDMPFDISDITDWEKAKTRLFLRVIGKKPDAIYRKVADLYLVPYIQLSNDGSAITRVTTQIFDGWNVSKEKVFNAAKRNQVNLRPVKITHICDRIGIPRMGLDIYIISTKDETNGASAIFYDGVVEQVRDLLHEEFYLIPSSIHEMLAVPKSFNANVEELAQMVTEINGAEVDEQDRLSNSIYTYDFEENKFKKVS